jgi:hypothetical protein
MSASSLLSSGGCYCMASTFLLGWGIEKAGILLHLPEKVLTSLVLLGTLKDGLAGGPALALFSKKTSFLRRFRLFS